MAQPVWVTPAGNLGTIPEGIFYKIPLEAYDPAIGDPVFYQVVAGHLPNGIQIQESGLLTGIPKAVATIQGVPAQVNRDVTSKFAIRAFTRTTVNGVTRITNLADRTFSITVAGQNVPQWITPAGQLTQTLDGRLFSFQVVWSDADQYDPIIVQLISGSLPPGLTITNRGLISGFLTPGPSANYEFLLSVTDGKSNDVRSFSIFVWSTITMTADNTLLRADNTYITADVVPIGPPVILTPQGSIGSIRSDNFFAFHFDVIDVDGLAYQITSNNLPPGLTLDPTSGWLYGYIPNLGVSEKIFYFSLTAELIDYPVVSPAYNYSLAITGSINNEITWLTGTVKTLDVGGATYRDLGTINNGSTSIFYVKAINAAGLELQYQLLSGSNSLLPQGLELLPSGDIVGRVSFDTFVLDGGTTTFDVAPQNNISDPTTFDLTHFFTVTAYSVNGVVNVNQVFAITVVRAFEEPYENLYIQAMPPQNNRDLVNSLLHNSDIFQPSLIYRSDDPNFGVATNIVYMHAYGLNSSTIADYYSSLYENHYWKNLVLGAVETAQARDYYGNIVYEVVYSRVIDNLVNDQGQSVSKQVTLPYAVDSITTVYPNSLIDMRNQVIDTVGQVSNVLPLWMTSKQENGKVLGFVPAWVIAYTKPGKAKQVSYYIAEEFGEKLNLIDFEVDRYELDRLLTKNWLPATTININNISGNGTSVTVTYDNQYTVPFAVNETITIANVTPPIYNRTYTVTDCSFTEVTFLSNISNAYSSGGTVSSNGSWFQIDDGQANSSPSVTTFDVDTPVISWKNNSDDIVEWTITSGIVTWTSGVPPGTTFDNNSLQFIAPVDMYSTTQAYDKYLVFPHRTILG